MHRWIARGAACALSTLPLIAQTGETRWSTHRVVVVNGKTVVDERDSGTGQPPDAGRPPLPDLDELLERLRAGHPAIGGVPPGEGARSAARASAEASSSASESAESSASESSESSASDSAHDGHRAGGRPIAPGLPRPLPPLDLPDVGVRPPRATPIAPRPAEPRALPPAGRKTAPLPPAGRKTAPLPPRTEANRKTAAPAVRTRGEPPQSRRSDPPRRTTPQAAARRRPGAR